MIDQKFTKIRNEILNWYLKNKREFPWRHTENFFQILISEILLQKTIASNVKNLYRKFFKKYSSFKDISDVKLSELQSDIKLLGLSNKRSKILKELSEMIIKDYNGNIPEDYKLLKKVCGIADYVSNAYACVALNKRTFFFDVNIKRFITRVFKTLDSNVKNGFVIDILERILPESECKHFYWAILDFGSKICRKQNPNCEICPISEDCCYF